MSIRFLAALAAALPLLAFAKLDFGPSPAPLPAPTSRIDGAFGFHLGEVFIPDGRAEEVTSSPLTEKALPGSLFRVTPPPGYGSEMFSVYYILRTLKTHQIAAIYAAAAPTCERDDSEAQALARSLTQRYAPDIALTALPLQINRGSRQIVLQCTPRYLKLVYADTDLAYEYAREAAEMELGEE